jgi:hypothetical protein
MGMFVFLLLSTCGVVASEAAYRGRPMLAGFAISVIFGAIVFVYLKGAS